MLIDALEISLKVCIPFSMWLRQTSGMVLCPCGVCQNEKDYPSSKTLHIALEISLKACILFSIWLRQTSGMVLCVVHAVFVRMRRITLPQRPFTSTCFGSVSCPAIIVGPSMKKEGL
jgi:hypothetical protein